MLAVLLAALESDADRQKFAEIYEKYHDAGVKSIGNF